MYWCYNLDNSDNFFLDSGSDNAKLTGGISGTTGTSQAIEFVRGYIALIKDYALNNGEDLIGISDIRRNCVF